MKKSTKCLVLSGMAIISGISAFAQNPKQCDLMLMLTTPAANAVYNYGDQVSVSFNIMNMGPADIAANDTIYFSIGNNVLSAIGAIPAGATSSIDLGPVFNNTNETGSDVTDNFCVKLQPQSAVTNNGMPVTVTYTDPVASNDSACNKITLKSKVPPPPVGISEVQTTKGILSLYPNPARDKVMFDIALENPETATAIIRDVTGREVMQKDFGKVQAGASSPLELNIAHLNAGIYIVEVTAGDKKFIGKVTKQN